jgi:hypothetical protein
MTNSQSKKCAIIQYTYQKLLLPLQLVDDFALLLQPLLEALLSSRMDNCNDANVVSWARLFSLKQQQIPSNALTRHSAVKSQPPNGGPSPLLFLTAEWRVKAAGKAVSFVPIPGLCRFPLSAFRFPLSAYLCPAPAPHRIIAIST